MVWRRIRKRVRGGRRQLGRYSVLYCAVAFPVLVPQYRPVRQASAIEGGPQGQKAEW